MAAATHRRDRRRAEIRVELLQKMIHTLDADIGGVQHPEWAHFWRDMRRLYSRASLYLATGLRTGDEKALANGFELWEEIEALLRLAERRLDASG